MRKIFRAAGFVVLWLPVAGAGAVPDPSVTAPELFTAEDKAMVNGGDAALSLHKLNYAVQGKDGLKLQYSFKYRVMDRARFFLAYTNTMEWRVFHQSIPVRDNIFNPEAFYRLKEEKAWFLSLDAGYFHLSNGRDGVDSRSIDRLFLRVHKSGALGRMPWHGSSQVFVATLDKDPFTEHYSRYVGWWDVTFWLRNLLGQKRSGLDLQLQRTAGTRGHPFHRGQNVVGLQYQSVHWDRVNPLLYLQWFNGYGELLINYGEYVNKLRAGISWFY